MSVFILLLACTEPTPMVADTDATPPATDTDSWTDTGDTDDTDPGPVPFRPEQLDCPDLPPLPTEFTNLPGFGPHEDFGFDAHGNLVAVGPSGNLASRNLAGETTLISPNVGEAKGTRTLPDGSVAIALSADGAIGRIMPDGQQLILAAVPAPNGIAIDLYGNVWVASSTGALFRVSPNGEQLVVGPFAGSLDGIALSPDFRKVYFNSEFGRVRVLELDDDANPVGTATTFAEVPLGLGIAILDGMTTDMCGNLYVTRMDGRIFRFLPDGTRDGIMNVSAVGPLFTITPALNFGSGIGGFERDHLYIQNFLGGVIEADIGIDGHWEPHYPVPQ